MFRNIDNKLLTALSDEIIPKIPKLNYNIIINSPTNKIEEESFQKLY